VDFFGEETHIGKTLGTDLASGKLTLPLIDGDLRQVRHQRLTPSTVAVPSVVLLWLLFARPM
jgi:geranylgeranyl pyrophosphate synthase